MTEYRLSKDINFIISDFDGVFTDNSVYIDAKGNESKKISYRDVMAVSRWIKSGFNIAIISGEKSSAIEYFRKKFKIAEIHQDIRNKKEVVEKILKKYNLSEENFLYIGDDINDIAPMKSLKYIFAPKNAHKNVKAVENIQIIDIDGGNGVIREITDSLSDIKNA